MWSSSTESLADGRALKIHITADSSPIAFAEVLALWRNDAYFRDYFRKVLSDVPFAAFRWETPPIAAASCDRPFECVVLDSPFLAKDADAQAFASHFSGNETVGAVSFANLGGDATMIVPCPRVPNENYAHLAAFVRGAPQWQVDALWRLVGEEMQQRVSSAPVWLSTAGAGVAWLHVRIDSRPKYYGHRPYRDAR